MKTKAILLLSVLLTNLAMAQDKEGSEDHPLIPRFGQSRIYDYEKVSFDRYNLATGKTTDYTQLSSKKTIEGEITKIYYTISTSDATTFEIYRNYMNALKAKNAEILFECMDNSCGKYFLDALSKDASFLIPAYYGEKFGYIAGKFSKDGKTYFVTVFAGYGLGEQGYEIHVIETEDMEQKIDLDGIEAALNEEGKVSLYGILFETGSATLKSESYTEIALVADYLKRNPTEKVYVVGHTDNTGGFDSNMSLSEKRAQSVLEALQSKHGIQSSRLKAAGVGPVAPVSTNSTEEGRTKNRRVELVRNSSN
ncbi:OmpA family protein [Jiulongibacter sp. NS-SX5]|uniref:OmpA family protein n=1 Tax=Jiulongibacter sp. NS-SX5 TaxID=3463854 RepID=UPI0040590A4B